MGKYQAIEGQNDFVRDTETGAVININKQEIQAARERKRILAEQKEEKDRLKNEVDSLKQEMSEIKGLLSKIVEKL